MSGASELPGASNMPTVAILVEWPDGHEVAAGEPPAVAQPAVDAGNEVPRWSGGLVGVDVVPIAAQRLHEEMDGPVGLGIQPW